MVGRNLVLLCWFHGNFVILSASSQSSVVLKNPLFFVISLNSEQKPSFEICSVTLGLSVLEPSAEITMPEWPLWENPWWDEVCSIRKSPSIGRTTPPLLNNISHAEESFFSVSRAICARGLCWHYSCCLCTANLSPCFVVLLAKPGHRDQASAVANATLNLHEGREYHTPRGAGHSLSAWAVRQHTKKDTHIFMCCSLRSSQRSILFSTAILRSLKENGFPSALI